MSLDFELWSPSQDEEHKCSKCGRFQPALWIGNVTHNLGEMFNKAGAYNILWYGDGLTAGDQVHELEIALAWMVAEPAYFKRFNPDNGWGTYEGAVEFLKDVIAACKQWPEAVIRSDR